MHNIISVKQLRQDLGRYEALVSKGRSFMVMKRSRPIFRIGPIEDENWETVIDFTKFKKGGISAKELLATLIRI